MFAFITLTMDRARPASAAKLIKRIALVAGLAVVLVGGGVTLAHIDFSTQRVAREKLSIETVQAGTMEVKVSANGQLLPKNIEQIASQVTGRVAHKYVRPGDRVKVGALVLELTNPQLIASAEEAYSAWEGAVTELQAAESELQTNLLNQQIVLTQAQFSLEAARVQLEAQARLSGQHIIPEIDFKRSQLN
ncbi:MAG: hypothetical protein JWO52_4153, partial [Gammaproteobacteria bacterium]|nr:hypothetical protein [Gammaproteobacteria bacterium]